MYDNNEYSAWCPIYTYAPQELTDRMFTYLILPVRIVDLYLLYMQIVYFKM